MDKTLKILIYGGVAALLIAIFIVFGGEGSQKSSENGLVPKSSFSHAHGLAVDIDEANKLYIATHEGLYLLKDDKDLFKIGKNSYDLMGFTAHPNKSGAFFSSGHGGGAHSNLGFQKSEDRGISWQKISDGVSGPVDFHAMAVSAANPETIYGFYAGKLQKSIDGGKNFEIVDTDLSQAGVLASDPTDEKVLYATTGEGLMKTIDGGKSWTTLKEASSDDPILALSVNPTDEKEIIIFSKTSGIMKSNDGGKEWVKIGQIPSSKSPMYFAYNKKDPKTIYTDTMENEIWKSVNGGETWVKVK